MSRPIRILELRSVRGTGGGPEKTILLGAARSDPSRFAITVCYLRDQRDPIFSIDRKAAGLKVEYVELHERSSYDPAVWQNLQRLVRERGIDIVHAHDYKTDLLAWLLSRYQAVTALSTAHGWTGHSARERYVYYPLDKRLLAHFTRVVAVSDEIRGELIRCGASPERVTTVLNGIDHQMFRRDRALEQSVRLTLGLAATDVVLGTVGRLEPQKRFDLLISAMQQLKSDHPTIKLLIVGDGSLRAALGAQIAALQLEKTCLLLGHRTDVTYLHHAFDLFVQASDYEGTPNSVLEAMALETPVVATAAGGTAQLIRDGIDGIVVPSGRVDPLVEAIRRALSDRAALSSYAQAARRRVDTDLSFDARMSAVEAIYTELAEARQTKRCRGGQSPAVMKAVFKGVARSVATLVVAPQLASFALRAVFMGRDRALEGSTQWLSLVPGLTGQYLRRAFLARVLAGGCASSAAIEFGTVFSQAGARIDANVYVGPRCHLGLVHLEANVLLAAGVHVPSGAHTHGTKTTSAIRDQPGTRRLVRIGAGSWIGSNAVVLADIGRDTVVGAGAVVTRPLPDAVIAGGVPARVLKTRRAVDESM